MLEIVKDVMNAISNFHCNEYLEKSLNASYIVFAPKTISLIGSVYRIFSKLLAERLNKVAYKLVNGHKLAFLRGRQTDHECFFDCQ